MFSAGIAIELKLLFPKQETMMTLMTRMTKAWSRLTCETCACSSLCVSHGDEEC
jgi:hypothetical protein